MKRLNIIILAALSVVLAGSALVPAASVYAQGSAALSIVPKKNYVIEPGKSVNDTLTIRNIDREKPLQLSLRVVDFTSLDETGAPKLFLDADEPQKTWSLKPYLKIPKTVKIEPGSSETLDMSVEIPENRGAGSLYSAIVYSTGAPEGGNVGLSASGVTLVFANIPGEVKQDLTLQKFGAYASTPDGKSSDYSYFNLNKPKQMAYTLKNAGNVTEAPVGSITLKHLFGHEVVINDVNPSGSLALIGQTRTYVSCMRLNEQNANFDGTREEAKLCADTTLWPGYYSASLDLFYGQNGNATKEINGGGGFWYLPWWFLAIVAVLLIAIIGGVWLIVRKIRGGKKVKANTKK